MKRWWRRRPLKVRLAVWFTAVASGLLLGLTPVVYLLIERRLHVEFDRQLRIDWDLVEAHLEADPAGRIQWRTGSPATPDSPGYAATWFDVWAGNDALLRHQPEGGAPITAPPQMLTTRAGAFYTVTLANGMPARALQQPASIGQRQVMLRVFRDESGLHRTLREILTGFALGVPLAAVLAALGGYVMAGRMLKPVGVMAEQARRITSESLHQRLPNPNPHDELGQLAAVFNETLQRLENSFDSLKRFTADASHELRTPLAALRSVGEVALREASEAGELRETIGSMLEEAQRLNDLIDAMLMFARVDSGGARVCCEAVPLDDLVAEVCERMEVLATEKRQNIEVAAGCEALVHADPLLLRQAVMNILHNAILYSPPGSTTRIRCARNCGDAVIEITDQGPGIAPEHQSKIFERFYRIDKARSRTAGGTGLGLAIAKLSVERMGGSIQLTSAAGKGSTFRIALPAAP
jgi:heavy metal sensor kinase